MFYINIIKVEKLSNTNRTVQDSAKNKREQNSAKYKRANQCKTSQCKNADIKQCVA